MGAGRAAALAALAAVAASGCGSGERQDADEPAGSFRVDVVDASFPERQRLAQQTEMTIRVRNAGTRAIPNLAITVDRFSRRSQETGLADASRPVWIVDREPAGGTTAYVNTWSQDAVAPGQTRTFTWRVTAMAPGRHELTYRVAAGLDGRAKAVTRGGRPPEGSFSVTVSDRPVRERVDPETGEVVPVETPAR
ncbi:MAG: hypothetical protein AVDCRST_MAG13-2072 [uncultured Solirubrobacteraceae bacterium]|uniref:Uncharacterized protein n=1 Tax=uncultured Solirubrobacteraceae bacterium TaxID=1162706 RepID=A0A6J4SMK7_9ACTN|nr:MAG: hypothetical protein AVDCRST_MAG13-2072 [uncultured Solirubrobacteraceae bacterium]